MARPLQVKDKNFVMTKYFIVYQILFVHQKTIEQSYLSPIIWYMYPNMLIF